MSTQHKVTIVGAGLSGPLMALYLAERGDQVELFEQRADVRRSPQTGGRSINLTIAERGRKALRRVGLEQEVITKLGVPGSTRVIHDPGGNMLPVRQGEGQAEVLYTVSRAELTRLLLDAADEHPRITLHFERRCVDLDKATARTVFENARTGERHEEAADYVIGADGTYSTVRRLMQSGEFADLHQRFVGWRYREVAISAAASEEGGFDPLALHIWPRGDRIMFALPNRDGSFNGICVLPAAGPNSFESLVDDRSVLDFFEMNFRDVIPYAHDLADRMLARPAGFPTLETSAWHYRDKVILLGDACHTVIPFYGQGMNAAFEDCVVLTECLTANPVDRNAAFASFQRSRKPDTDALSALSKQNFDEILDIAGLPAMMLRRRWILKINRLVKRPAMPLYAMVTYTTIPYAECVRRAARQDEMARRLGLDLAVAITTAWRAASSAVERRRWTRRLWPRQGARTDLD